MRADRLISLLLLLQSNGRMTADALAQKLEVSERTIYRDIEALSFAGIPVYTQPGTQGGVFLDEQYRVSLTGLSQSEVQSLFTASESHPLRELGLSQDAENSRLKLLANLPGKHRQAVEQMQQRLYIDTTNWFQLFEEPSYLPALQEAVRVNRVIEMHYEHSRGEVIEMRVRAIGLVAKANIWYVIGQREDGEIRNYRMSRIESLEITDETFERDPAFDLKAYWQASCEKFERESQQTNPPYGAVLRVHPAMQWYFPQFMAGRYERLGEPDADGWVHIRVLFYSFEDARMRVIGLGTNVEIIEPDALREVLLTDAQNLVKHLQKPDRMPSC